VSKSLLTKKELGDSHASGHFFHKLKNLLRHLAGQTSARSGFLSVCVWWMRLTPCGIEPYLMPPEHIMPKVNRRKSPEVNPSTLVEALELLVSETERGITFVDRDFAEQFVSWSALRSQAMVRAAHFRKAGLTPGQRVAIVLPEGQDFIPAFLGAVWAGLVPVPLYPPLSLGKLDSYIDTLAAILARATPSILVTTSQLQQVLWSGASRCRSIQGVLTAEELARPAPNGIDQSAATISGEDIAFVQFTSGSTSLPKGVVVTHENLRANAWAIMRDGLKTDSATDRGVSWLPLYHDMGLIGFVIAPLFHRVQITFLPTLAFVRNANLWLEAVSRYRGTITYAPNFAYALATKRAKNEQLENWDLSRVRVFGCGAEPIHAATMQAFVEKFAACGLKASALLPSYGMAEATLAISFVGLDESLSVDTVLQSDFQTERKATPALETGAPTQAFVSCGKTFPDHEVRAFDGYGKPLEARRIGELWVRGPSVAKGYYLDPEATEKTFGGGWLKTGDLGYLVDDNVYITGRQKDLIIINGRNYDPQRIEWTVDEVNEVRKGSSVAFSQPGTSSELLVVALESRTENKEALVAAVTQAVAEATGLTVSEVVVCPVGSLPKTSSGKLQRAKTREQFLSKTIGTEGNRTAGSGAEKLVLAKHVARSLFGRTRNRARQVFVNAAQIRTLDDAKQKFKLAQDYLESRFRRVLG
jgi:fatty-acyl-CoA synthase